MRLAPATCIQTYSGMLFDFLDPQPSSVRAEDIFRVLARLPRFGGHTRRLYTVAQHCVHVSQYCAAPDALEGLAHDWTEAYIGDIPTPLKRLLAPQITDIEQAIWSQALRPVFRLAEAIPASVKVADRRMLATEATQLLGRDDFGEPYDFPIRIWTEEESYWRIKERFEELYKERA